MSISLQLYTQYLASPYSNESELLMSIFKRLRGISLQLYTQYLASPYSNESELLMSIFKRLRVISLQLYTQYLASCCHEQRFDDGIAH
jgi:hypothetical protein